jgi:hypothetical protein
VSDVDQRKLELARKRDEIERKKQELARKKEDLQKKKEELSDRRRVSTCGVIRPEQVAAAGAHADFSSVRDRLNMLSSELHAIKAENSDTNEQQ